MKLKRLDISGFKSFHDRATIHFPPGISAVVGPNGCGKSNILDALRWVMGEQSARQLRGKSMEDVIFSGADGHPAVNMAEVSLTLANDNGSAPESLKAYSEIMLTRRLYRSGESVYLFNKQPCRLKDITHVLLGSGMGARSYAVIQQGNIGAITDAGPEERRVFIEEAAGVSRYKVQKTEALRKVAATRENLLRVQDILSEIDRQRAALERQAKKAERFKKLRREERFLDLQLSLLQHASLQKTAAGMDADHENLSRENAACQAEHTRLADEQQRLKEALEAARARVSRNRNDMNTLQRDLDRMASDRSHLVSDVRRIEQEQAKLASERERLTGQDAELSDEASKARETLLSLQGALSRTGDLLQTEKSRATGLRERLSTLEGRLSEEKKQWMEQTGQEAAHRNACRSATTRQETLTRRLKRMDEEMAMGGAELEKARTAHADASRELKELEAAIESLMGDISSKRAALSEQSGQLEAHRKVVRQLESAHHHAASRYEAFRKTADDFKWYREGVQAVMTAASPPFPKEALLATVADTFTPRQGFETAAESALGEALQYVVVADGETALLALDYLKKSQKGRAGFMIVDQGPPPPSGSVDTDFSHHRLIDRIEIRPGFESIVRRLMGDVLVAEDLPQALLMKEKIPGRSPFIVTLEGDLLTREGALIGGDPGKTGGILAKKRELDQLKKETEAASSRLSEALTVQAALEARVHETESALAALSRDRQDADRQRMGAEKASFAAAQKLDQARLRVEVLDLEKEQLSGEADDAAVEMAACEKALHDIEAAIADSRLRMEAVTNDIDAARNAWEAFQEKNRSLELDFSRIQTELSGCENEIRRMRRFQEEAAKRLSQIDAERDEKKLALQKTHECIARLKEAISEGTSRFDALSKTLGENQKAFGSLDTALREREAEALQKQAEHDGLRTRLQALEVERSRVRMQMESLVSRLDERYHAGIEVLKQSLAEAPDTVLPTEEKTEESLEERLAAVQNRIAAMGDVHLGAIAEFEALQERASFVESQRDDLVQAIEDLHRVIHRINQISRERFTETLDAVNAKLEEIFPKLFTGGTARLVMTDPKNVLETGLEFLIHPPGKKLTRISLLSGGEKALSAIAFIFSIFLIKPASFCLLDEIDAPLDEANVHRFNHLLQMIGEKSQIVMVTHNKRSMEFADTLFGVTMERQGVSKVVSVNLEKAA